MSEPFSFHCSEPFCIMCIEAAGCRKKKPFVDCCRHPSLSHTILTHPTRSYPILSQGAGCKSEKPLYPPSPPTNSFRPLLSSSIVVVSLLAMCDNIKCCRNILQLKNPLCRCYGALTNSSYISCAQTCRMSNFLHG